MKNQSLVKGRVQRIIDGDTFTVAVRGQEKTIRIACIDAPEMSEGSFGKESKDILTGMLRVGSMVKLEEHDTDRYWRTVAEVFSGRRQKNVGLEMVKKGYAEIYDEYAYQCDGDKLTKFESRARKRDKGHWDVNGFALPFTQEVTPDPPGDIKVVEPVVQEPVVVEEQNLPPAYSGSRDITCSQLSNRREALQWLQQGHQYLDTDYDGVPCESLPY